MQANSLSHDRVRIPQPQSVLRGDGYRTWIGMILCWLCLAGAMTPALGQAPDPIDNPKPSLIQTYADARNAFAKNDWSSAADLFRGVSRDCIGSPLALEANYFALLADWQRRDQHCRETVDRWLEEAQRLQQRMVKDQRAAPEKLDTWIANAQFLAAQSERQAKEFDRAETRLKALLQLDGTQRDPQFAWPEQVGPSAAIWNELGIIARDSRQDWQQARTCFIRAVEASQESTELHCNALASLALSQLQLSETDACHETISQLERSATRDDWRVRAALLRAELARARKDAAAFAEALRPAAEIAFAGRTDLLLAYELATALLEAREDERGEALLIELIHREPTHPVAIESRIRLARQDLARGQWEDAQKLLDDAIALPCPTTWISHARLARSNIHLHFNRPEEAEKDLTVALQYVSDDIELETTIRLQLGEVLAQLQQWDEASNHWSLLASRLENASSVGQDASAIPAWMARVWLHQAEMHALKQEWESADAIVSRIQRQFPECECRDDVDYMRARCLISKAQFEEARHLLTSVAGHSVTRSPDLAARSWWMVGETYLLQRRYQDAIRAYEKVLGVACSTYWQSAARIQMGRCHELLNDVTSARTVYQSVLEHDAEGAFGAIARERIESLPNQTNANSNRNARTFNDPPDVHRR